MKCNPYLPFYEYIPDGEPRIFEGRLYIYGSHDEPNVNKFCPKDYVVWSCDEDDIGNWRCEGISYKRTDDPHNLNNQHSLFAPDVIKGPDGNYYLYYCLDFLQEIGVAKSPYPQGPFQFYNHIHYKNGNLLHEYFPYDPSVLVDDDGAIYVYYGFSAHFENGSFGDINPSPGCMVMELERDMVTIKKEPKLCLPTELNCKGTSFPAQHAYFEAPSVRKINGIYYLVYSSQRQHELCYAVSKSPNCDFVYGGVIISNGDIGLEGNKKPVNYVGTNHGGLVQIKDIWYIFYHRNTHGIATSRQGCAEKIEIQPDGSIQQVGVSSYGLLGKAFYEKRTYSAYEACYLECLNSSPKMKINTDLKTQEPYYMQRQGVEQEYYIANLKNQCMWGFHSFELSGDVKIVLSIRGKAEGRIVISTDRTRKNMLAAQNILIDTRNWTTIFCSFRVSPGVYKLYFVFYGSGSIDFRDLTFK